MLGLIEQVGPAGGSICCSVTGDSFTFRLVDLSAASRRELAENGADALSNLVVTFKLMERRFALGGRVQYAVEVVPAYQGD